MHSNQQILLRSSLHVSRSLIVHASAEVGREATLSGNVPPSQPGEKLLFSRCCICSGPIGFTFQAHLRHCFGLDCEDYMQKSLGSINVKHGFPTRRLNHYCGVCLRNFDSGILQARTCQIYMERTACWSCSKGRLQQSTPPRPAHPVQAIPREQKKPQWRPRGPRRSVPASLGEQPRCLIRTDGGCGLRPLSRQCTQSALFLFWCGP